MGGQLTSFTDVTKTGQRGKANARDHMAKSRQHTHYHVEQKAGLLMILTVSLTMENGSCQNFPFGAAHELKSLGTSRK